MALRHQLVVRLDASEYAFWQMVSDRLGLKPSELFREVLEANRERYRQIAADAAPAASTEDEAAQAVEACVKRLKDGEKICVTREDLLTPKSAALATVLAAVFGEDEALKERLIAAVNRKR